MLIRFLESHKCTQVVVALAGTTERVMELAMMAVVMVAIQVRREKHQRVAAAVVEQDLNLVAARAAAAS